jgi:hypothetical protein
MRLLYGRPRGGRRKTGRRGASDPEITWIGYTPAVFSPDTEALRQRSSESIHVSPWLTIAVHNQRAVC